MSFRQMVTRALLRGLLVLAVAYIVLAPPLQPHSLPFASTPQSVGAEGSVSEQLREQHGCWRLHDVAPQAPTRAIVELNSRQGPVLADAAVGYAIWRDGAAGTLYAFCP
jgi:hypothetical protein